MAKVHHRRANKAYPQAGIEKGDMYYFAQIKTGPRSSRTIRQKTPIKPSQMTSSEYLQSVFAIQEGAESYSSLDDYEGVPDGLRGIAEREREKFENMPGSLQQSDTGQLLEERASSCDEIADRIEEIVSGWDADEARAEVMAENEGEDLTEDEIDAKVEEKREELAEGCGEALNELLT